MCEYLALRSADLKSQFHYNKNSLQQKHLRMANDECVFEAYGYCDKNIFSEGALFPALTTLTTMVRIDTCLN